MDYYKTVVGRRGISPEYFWYEMSNEEVSAIYDAQLDEHKEKWDQTRIIAYYAASGMSKLPEINKFMPFPWDKDAAPENNEKPSEDRMNSLINMIQNGNKL